MSTDLIPLAFLMFNAARRLIRLSAVVAVGEAGDSSDCDDLPDDALPRLWKIPLFGMRSDTARFSAVPRDTTKPSSWRNAASSGWARPVGTSARW